MNKHFSLKGPQTPTRRIGRHPADPDSMVYVVDAADVVWFCTRNANSNRGPLADFDKSRHRFTPDEEDPR